jgi:hypothetical protein
VGSPPATAPFAQVSPKREDLATSLRDSFFEQLG